MQFADQDITFLHYCLRLDIVICAISRVKTKRYGTSVQSSESWKESLEQTRIMGRIILRNVTNISGDFVREKVHENLSVSAVESTTGILVPPTSWYHSHLTTTRKLHSVLVQRLIPCGKVRTCHLTQQVIQQPMLSIPNCCQS